MAQTDFETDDNDCDGYVIDQHACGYSVDNSATSMRCGGSSLKCFTDNLSDRYHSNCSFPTGTLPNDATITAVALFIYFNSRVVSKGWGWSGIYDARLEVTTAKNIIGEFLGTGNYDYGTRRYNAVAFKNWVLAGWKELDLGSSAVYVDGDTDCEIRPNDDWWQDCDDQGRNYYLLFRTNESLTHKPYLRVTYTLKGKTFVTIIGAN